MIDLERETLHIMDDKQRVALVESRTQGDDGSPAQLVRYQYGNHLGSATLELDEQAQIISYEEYYPYGSTSYQSVDKTIKATAKRYRYTGKEQDEESGLYYHGARYYACWLGRWCSCDPKGISQEHTSQSKGKDQPSKQRFNQKQIQGLFVYGQNNPIKLRDIDGLSPTPYDLAQQIQQQTQSLLQVISTHHGFLRGTFEAAIAEAQGAEIVGSAGQTFRHIQSMEEGARALISREQGLTQSLQALRQLDPKAAGELSQALRPLLDRARELLGLSEQTRAIIAEIGVTANEARLEGVPLNTGRDIARLASSQLSQMRMSLVPNGVAQYGWVQNTIERIRQLPVTPDQLREQAKNIATAVGGAISTLTAATRVGATVARSALSRFFGAALGLLEALGSSLVTLPIFIIPVDKNGRMLIGPIGGNSNEA